MNRSPKPTSRLPEDAAYWTGLTDRLVMDAADRLRTYRGVETRWWDDLVRVSVPVTVGAAAALVAALLWLPGGERDPGGGAPRASPYGFEPNDPMAAALLAAAAPPTMATIISMTPHAERAP